MRHYLVLIGFAFFLTSCGGPQRPAESPPPTPTADAKNIQFGGNPPTVDSEVLTVTATAPAAADSTAVRIIEARPAGFFAIQTQDVGAGGYTSGSYLVTKQTSLEPVQQAVVTLVIANSSSRAFAMDGAVIRVESSRPEIKASYPQDVTNAKKLAPGESMSVPITLTGVQSAATGDTVSIKFYELPKSIAADGSVAARGAGTIVLSMNVTTAPVEIPTYTLEEKRRWPKSEGEHPADLAKFFRR